MFRYIDLNPSMKRKLQNIVPKSLKEFPSKLTNITKMNQCRAEDKENQCHPDP